MTLDNLRGYWPWAVAYLISSLLIFLWLRLHSSTDDRAAQLTAQPRSFGDPTTLPRIAAEFFRTTCARMLLAMTVAGWSIRVVLGGWSFWDLLIIAGVALFWPLQEWLIHVFLLHLKPFSLFGRTIDPVVSRNHRNHHRNPWDPVLGITPAHMIWVYMVWLPVVWLLFVPFAAAMTGVSAYLTLALNYEWVHYLIHTSYAPRTSLYRRLWRNHRLHHFKNEHYWYGVTMLGGDRLMHTQPSSRRTARSETCLTLGVEDQLAGWTEPAEPTHSLGSLKDQKT